MSINGSVPLCAGLSPRSPKGNWILQSDVGHAGDEVPQGGRPVVWGRAPGLHLGKIRVEANVPLGGQHPLGPILQGRQRIVAQTTVFGALQHVCGKTKQGRDSDTMNDVRQRDFFIVLIKSSKARGDELPGKTPVCDLNLGEVCTLIIKKLDWGGGGGEH